MKNNINLYGKESVSVSNKIKEEVRENLEKISNKLNDETYSVIFEKKVEKISDIEVRFYEQKIDKNGEQYFECFYLLDHNDTFIHFTCFDNKINKWLKGDIPSLTEYILKNL